MCRLLRVVPVPTDFPTESFHARIRACPGPGITMPERAVAPGPAAPSAPSALAASTASFPGAFLPVCAPLSATSFPGAFLPVCAPLSATSRSVRLP